MGQADAVPEEDSTVPAAAAGLDDRAVLAADSGDAHARAAILRSAVRAMKQPKRTQFEMRIGRALRRQRPELRDAELAAVELELQAYLVTAVR